MVTWPWQKKSPPEPESTDRVWVSLAARDRAVVRAAQAGPLVVLAFFDETVERLRAALKQAGLGERPQLVVARIDQLEHRPTVAQVIIAERHPMPANNRALLERLHRDAPLSAAPTFFSALDDAFLTRMSGNQLVTLMRQLGMNEDEPIEHPMIGKALKNARDKAEKDFGTKAPMPASSLAEWVHKNMG